ncbi:4'-phosphopantetheinyl transferase superfamily protein [Actinomadura sp. ATCC 31491]|uniref:4'-phosphopantetheinyl transferase superfamily protein n=1 Tax=Actinomadura luzonensis TaxID=2805427 RepID=A0ABT0FWB1_9ACTN|nr:4'-phosphopantetheinyl transferase superfamily protein [Actinomadura luzonensis]MCK2216211.1 4'-phosphopantetheinyl transferase superfamily protein [Actinomadura luzonensis]
MRSFVLRRSRAGERPPASRPLPVGARPFVVRRLGAGIGSRAPRPSPVGGRGSFPALPEVRVWKVFLDGPRWQGGWEWLSGRERERALALAGELDRRRYVAAHAALRAVLGRVCGLPPHEVRLATDDAGRPCLHPGTHDHLPGGLVDFNLSHSDSWALIALAPPGVRAGVDVERIRADLDPLAMADRLYQPEEAARLRAAAPAAALTGYFRLWTAKEAFVKATGAGLAGLSAVRVADHGHDEGSAASTGPRSLHGPVRWLRVAPGYAAALVTIVSTPAPRTG